MTAELSQVAKPAERNPDAEAGVSVSMASEERRELLNAILLEPDPTDGLWKAVDSGLAGQLVPELPALRLEQDPIHRHKDVLAHTIAVTAKTSPVLKLRLAALFHDIGKPATRSFEHGGVTFRHHEAVGAKITRRRLREMEYDKPMVNWFWYEDNFGFSPCFWYVVTAEAEFEQKYDFVYEIVWKFFKEFWSTVIGAGCFSVFEEGEYFFDFLFSDVFMVVF